MFHAEASFLLLCYFFHVKYIISGYKEEMEDKTVKILTSETLLSWRVKQLFSKNIDTKIASLKQLENRIPGKEDVYVLAALEYVSTPPTPYQQIVDMNLKARMDAKGWLFGITQFNFIWGLQSTGLVNNVISSSWQ